MLPRWMAGAAALLWCSIASAQTLALTFDDGLNPETESRAQEWNAQILAHMKAASVPAMVFPALAGTGRGEGINLIRAWSQAGHRIGNHTSRHRNLGSARVTLADFIEDVKEAEAVFSAMPGWTPMLRFPYLKEGETAEKRDGMRAWMRANGYKPAPVSIDTSDWYFNRVFIALSKENAIAKIAQLQQLYAEHLMERAGYYDKLAAETLGRKPSHVMLLHVNAINAVTLPRVIAAFRQNGWSFVAPAQAFADPLYASEPNTLPAGESIVWSLAKAAGVKDLRYPAEDSVYEEAKLRAHGLVP